MSHDRTRNSLEPTAQKLIAVAVAVCINVLLFWMLGALFATDSSVSSGGLLS